MQQQLIQFIAETTDEFLKGDPELADAIIDGEKTLDSYDFCKKTKDFKVVKVGSLVRVNKESFDNWFNNI